jgi:small-conductance mechanosensitive channel
MGLIIILDRFQVNISPLIAGLGISGLAVALALQPTLSNFLAGTYVMGDGVIRKGHYIAMEGGPEGFVEEIGWRTTKLRHWQGNLVILPNSKLADSIVTDFDVPDPPIVFVVECGVGYESDLKKVEQVTLEVARNILQSYPEGDKTFEPVVRFKEFGDSNINFAIVLKSVHRPGQFLLKHEFVKALHERFNQEGIEIAYPTRKLYMADGAAKLTQAELAGMAGSSASAQGQDPPPSKGS